MFRRLLFAAMFTSAVVAAADDPRLGTLPPVEGPGNPTPVELSGIVRIYYRADVDEKDDDENTFDAGRVSLSATAKADEKWSAKVTADLDAEDILLEAFGAYELGSRFRWTFGLSKTPYDEWIARSWDKNYIRLPILYEEVAGRFEFGTHIEGQFSDWLMYSAGLINDAPRGAADDDKYKALHGGLLIAPLARNATLRPLRVIFYGFTGEEDTVGKKRETGIISLGYAGDDFRMNFDWLRDRTGTDNGEGTSVGVTLPVGAGNSLIFRHDVYDPDTATTRDHHTVAVFGLEREFADGVRAALVYEKTDNKNAADEGTIGFNMELTW